MLLLLVVVVVPTLGVLWFVGVAMDNEQLAARQKLADAYRAHLLAIQHRLDDHWIETIAAVEADVDAMSPRACFAKAALSGAADAIVSYDDEGRLLYPQPPRTTLLDDVRRSPRWREAEHLEHEANQPSAAAAIYESIAQSSDEDSVERARAVQAQSRCLLKSGRTDEAARLILREFAEQPSADAIDIHGRQIAPNVELMAVEQLQRENRRDGAVFAALWTRLTDRLNDYSDESLASSQRLFLMNQVARLASPAGDESAPPTLRAEKLAADFVAAHPRPSRSSAWIRSQLPDVWQYASPSGRTVLLLETDHLRKLSEEPTLGGASPAEVQVELVPPQDAEQPAGLMSVAAGKSLPGWRLSLSLVDDQQFDDAVARRNTLHVWIGSLVVLSTSLLALFIARAFRRQMQLARLKNDLVGTVSHELKTPLASMRVLVDTLLDAERLDERQAREYLQLIAKENTRLSRLIDNFLTFSRMEQGRQVFAMQQVPPSEIVRRAVESAGERFRQDDCRLSIDAEDDLPALLGDSDALVTAVLNLLDNAYKFSDPPREIVLRTWSEPGRVCLSVSDNGVGMSRAAARRVFEQFFQVDQRLNRKGQGCGLGLSIVHYIVRAHGGEVRVDSQVGQGAVFTMRLPAQSAQTPTAEEALV